MVSPRVQRVLDVIDNHSFLGEVLLFKSFVLEQPIPFERTGDDTIDLILGCVADNIPADIQYDGSLHHVSSEYNWAHHKILGIRYDDVDEIRASGYDLTHQVFYGTDFARSPIFYQVGIDVVTDALAVETSNLDLIAEYCLCLYAFTTQPPQDKVDILIEWFDNTWDGVISHQAMVIAMLFHKIGL